MTEKETREYMANVTANPTMFAMQESKSISYGGKFALVGACVGLAYSLFAHKPVIASMCVSGLIFGAGGYLYNTIKSK